MARPNHVGARELKTRLGTYLRRVRAGETLVVTDRGEPAAELRPLPAEDVETRLARLQAAGRVTLPASPRLRRFAALRSRRSLAAAVHEDREDRF